MKTPKTNICTKIKSSIAFNESKVYVQCKTSILNVSFTLLIVKRIIFNFVVEPAVSRKQVQLCTRGDDSGYAAHFILKFALNNF